MRSREKAIILVVVLGVVAGAVAIGARLVVRHAGPIVKKRMIETLSERFNCRTELDSVDVSVAHGIEVTGAGLRLFPPAGMDSADAGKPLIAIDRFTFHAGLLGVFFTPMHVRLVTVSGMAIEIPPRKAAGESSAASSRPRKMPRPKIVVDEIACDDSRLVIDSNRPDKDPKIFELHHIVLDAVGSGQPWKFDAVLTNALPKGDIKANGTFGPWNTESPGDSSLAGHYTFEHADLGTIRGIGGTLHSKGEFRGQLDKIEVEGTTETPDFSLDIAGHPLPLETQFHAIVDGTTGDTYLQPVKAKLRDSNFTTSGAVIGVKGKGHRIELDVDIDSRPRSGLPGTRGKNHSYRVDRQNRGESPVDYSARPSTGGRTSSASAAISGLWGFTLRILKCRIRSTC